MRVGSWIISEGKRGGFIFVNHVNKVCASCLTPLKSKRKELVEKSLCVVMKIRDLLGLATLLRLTGIEFICSEKHKN